MQLGFGRRRPEQAAPGTGLDGVGIDGLSSDVDDTDVRTSAEGRGDDDLPFRRELHPRRVRFARGRGQGTGVYF